MILGYVVSVHGDGKEGLPFYTAYLEGFGGKQVEGHRLCPVVAQDYHPPFPPQSHPTLFPGPLNPERKKRRRKIISRRCLRWPRQYSSSVWKTRNLKNFSQMLKYSLSNFLKLSFSNKRTLLQTLGTNLSHHRSLKLITKSPEEEALTVLGYMLT
jgi:hypothetical protein